MSDIRRVRWGVNDEAKRVPAHAVCTSNAVSTTMTNREVARSLRHIPCMTLREIASAMRTTPTRVRELLRARKAA